MRLVILVILSVCLIALASYIGLGKSASPIKPMVSVHTEKTAPPYPIKKNAKKTICFRFYF